MELRGSGSGMEIRDGGRGRRSGTEVGDGSGALGRERWFGKRDVKERRAIRGRGLGTAGGRARESAAQKGKLRTRRRTELSLVFQCGARIEGKQEESEGRTVRRYRGTPGEVFDVGSR